jgi:membrane protease YdiL (CAAX protease family)
MKIKNQPWIQIGIYYAIAITISSIFRLEIFQWYNKIDLSFGLTVMLKALLESCGPFIGALIALRLTKSKHKITLFGSNTAKSILMMTFPVVLISIFGANNDLALNRHYYGFIMGLSIAFYGIFEEYGWRGYLQNVLIELKPMQKSLIIGVLWYTWHLSFLSKQTSILNELLFFGIILFGSWGIGAIAEKTKSIIASACFHIIGNILFLSPDLSSALGNLSKLIISGICLTFWIIIVNTWDKKLKIRTDTTLIK